MPTDPLVIAVVLFGAALGGVASGLAGFAFAATTLGLYAHVLSPEILSPVVVAASLSVQLMAIPFLWKVLDWRAAAPFLAAGLLGVPIGVAVLSLLSPDSFRLLAGIILLVYAVSVLVSGHLPAVRFGGRSIDAAVGFVSGILGGFAGLSGILPTIWCSLRRWPKDKQRSVFQLFNTTMHTATLIGYGVSGRLTAEVGWIVLLALPAVAFGGWLGLRLYRRVDDKLFARILLVLLGLSGLTMVAPHIARWIGM